MFLFRQKPLTLTELIDELEKSDDLYDVPDEIIIFPPDNANERETIGKILIIN
jgi:hypothetical protein